MSTFVQLGKHGDILSILPILHARWKETDHKSHLIVSKEYSEIPLELNYVQTEIFDGSWQDLKGAISFAKKRFDKVFVAQTFGQDFPIQRKHPSFQLDQWDRCGQLHQWGTLPLILPRNFGKLAIPAKPFILYGDYSESSPFDDREELFTALSATFPSHQIVRLSSIRLPRLLDLLALMDAADLLVCVESMPLHLSAASKTPMIALATDKPSRWHGSAFHPRMAMHCRYGDFQLRKAELLETARRCVNKQPMPYVEAVPTTHEFGYNLSQMRYGYKLLQTYRYHPKPTSWRTELAIRVGEGNKHETLPIKPPEQYSRHSFEDGRLFALQGRPYLSATVSRSRVSGQSVDPSITGYGELVPGEKMWRLKNWTEPKHPDNVWSKQTKNLVFFEFGAELFCTFQTYPNHVVLELDYHGNIKRSWKTPSPECSFGEYRGGTQMFPYAGNFIRFVHANLVNKSSDLWWNYALAAILIEGRPPFNILKVSQHPILVGNELYTPDCKHWKARVLIPYGAIEVGDGWDVSVGLNDCQCAMVHVKPDQLNL